MREESYKPTFRDIYHRLGMTDQDVADKAGLTRKTIWKLNHKQGDVWFSSVQAACKAVGISIDYYASLEPYRPPGYKSRGKRNEHV